MATLEKDLSATVENLRETLERGERERDEIRDRGRGGEKEREERRHQRRFPYSISLFYFMWVSQKEIESDLSDFLCEGPKRCRLANINSAVHLLLLHYRKLKI
jgi:hypothetical protein